MDALPLCMFLKLRVYFVEIVNLVGLACPIADHMGCGNYAITYADNQMELYLIVTLIKCAIKQNYVRIHANITSMKEKLIIIIKLSLRKRQIDYKKAN